MRMRKLGAVEVSELGFGTLSFASTYGQAPEKAESIRIIRGALAKAQETVIQENARELWTDGAM